MNVSLTPHFEELIHRKVESGRYSSTSEVVREALRLLEEHDRLAELRALIAVGDEQIARREIYEWTPGTMGELMREADEEDRLGLPIDEHVQP